MHGRRMTRSWWCWLSLPAGVWLAYQTHVFHRRLDWMPWQAPITALGTAVLCDVVVDAVKRRDVVDLGLAGWLFIMVPMSVYTHLPPKYFVPSAPAMAILLVRSCERLGRRPRGAFGAIAAIGFVLGVLVIRADAELADVGRQGGEVVASYLARGERVWFDGAWAFHWYAEQAGARPVTTDAPRPGPGDVVVVGLEGWVIKTWPNKQLLERRTFERPGGRILQKPAGFFSNVAWGPLPWVWSKRPHDPIEVWRIQ
jgi:hypothetical protein